mgnify:CR=1 FL=1
MEPLTPTKAHELMKKTTQEELEKLHNTMKNEGIRKRQRQETTYTESSDEETDLDSDYESEPEHKPSKPSKPLPFATQIYKDNQSLWKKNNNISIELDKCSTEIHHLRLELNNLEVINDEHVKIFKTLNTTISNKNFVLKCVLFVMTVNIIANIQLFFIYFYDVNIMFMMWSYVKYYKLIDATNIVFIIIMHTSYLLSKKLHLM